MVVERRMAFRGTVLCVTCSFWLVAVVGNVRSSLAEDDGWEPAGCAGAVRRGQLAMGI